MKSKFTYQPGYENETRFSGYEYNVQINKLNAEFDRYDLFGNQKDY